MVASTIAALPSAAQVGPLELIATVSMPGVKGRIDHLALDATHRRLLIAALGNGTLEVVTLDGGTGPALRRITGFSEPQGVLFIRQSNRVYVTSGSGDRVDVLDGSSLAVQRRFENLPDADNLRYDPAGRRVYIGYGKGALRVVDISAEKLVADIRLDGHPESFQLEQAGTRIFVNVPAAKHVAVVDRTENKMIAAWPLPGVSNNYPMALDEAGGRLFVGARNPPVLLVYDTTNGKFVARHTIGEDTDDIFFDAKRKHVYVVCGAGRIDVFRQDAPNSYTSLGSAKTAHRARTGLFVPEHDRLYIAAPAGDGLPARILVFKISS
jgi:DNA-binding beta-propeller fold protein YncE